MNLQISPSVSITQPTYQLDTVGVSHHQQPVDIIVCVHNALADVRVHNALADVQRCLDSIVQCTMPPYTLIIVDDGSQADTCHYLRDHAK